MQSRRIQSTLIFGTLIVLIILSAAGIWNVQNSAVEQRFPLGQLQGSSVWVENVEYPLNFEQHKKLIGYLNHCESVEGRLSSESSLAPITKVTIYRFEKPNLELYPRRAADGRATLSSTELSLVEEESNALWDIFKKTFDR